MRQSQEGLWNRIVSGGKAILLAILGIVMLGGLLGIGAMCQFLQGQARPHIPDPVRSLVTNPEDEAVVQEYLDNVDHAISRLLDEADRCKTQGSQPCLTKAFQSAVKDVGQGVPVEASWMSDSHGTLYDALNHMWQVHLRSETEVITSEFVDETVLATDELAAALEEWYKQAGRGD
jgi:hypothetical protein